MKTLEEITKMLRSEAQESFERLKNAKNGSVQYEEENYLRIVSLMKRYVSNEELFGYYKQYGLYKGWIKKQE